jgi:hypothetical protein
LLAALSTLPGLVLSLLTTLATALVLLAGLVLTALLRIALVLLVALRILLLIRHVHFSPVILGSPGPGNQLTRNSFRCS